MGASDKKIAQMNTEPFFYDAVFCNSYAMAWHRGGNNVSPPQMFDGFSYGGNTDPVTGFALPYFTKEVMIGQVNSFCATTFLYDTEQDAFVFTDRLGTGSVVSVYKGEDIEVVDLETRNTHIVHAYPVGGGPRWPWMEFYKQWKTVTRYICPYCRAETEIPSYVCNSCGRKVDG
jgi:hypothetical protein